jgi:hypothetical protein
LSVDVSQCFFAEQLAGWEDLPEFSHRQRDEIASGQLTPPISAHNLSLDQEGHCYDGLAAQSTAAQSAGCSIGHSPVLPAAATDASIGPAFPPAQSTAASRSHVEEPKKGKSPTRSAFSAAFQSRATTNNIKERQLGYEQGISRGSAMTSNTG